MITSLHPVALAVTMDVIRTYAVLTDDFNPIHVDPAFAATTPMGGCIAHGTLSMALLWQSLFRTLGDNAAGRVDLDVRFVKPVYAGDTLHAGGELLPGGSWAVWVRGGDAMDRITGTARLAPSKELA
jgi:3-hydroxybutyryl-CoA dehydratase